MKKRFPALFVGHGNPMNAISQNRYTQAWSEIAARFPTPKAILCISAHWYGSGTHVTAMETPRTIHDFGGFPPELFAFQYPAPGSPPLAKRVQALLGLADSSLDRSWGLDHGAWSVLCHLYPNADIPVVQLSLDETKPGAYHAALSQKLRPLRDEGILILGSGNLVHNLHAYAWGHHAPAPYDWAVRFENQARALMSAGEFEPLIDYESMGPDARLCVPTPDHFLPLLYILALREKGEKVSFPVDGVDGGSISMLAVEIG